MDSRFCYYCGNPLSRSQTTKDHIIPRSKGGTDAKKNLVDSCRTCNEEKGCLDVEEFRVVRAFKLGMVEVAKDFKFPGETKKPVPEYHPQKLQRRPDSLPRLEIIMEM